MPCSVRSTSKASSAVPTRPKFPHIISTVSKMPRRASTAARGSRRTSRTPRRRHTSTAPGEMSIATTSSPRRSSSRLCPTGSTADIENAPAHELEHLLFLSRPLAVLGEEDICRQSGTRATVVELEDQRTRLPRQMIEEQTPERVLLNRRGSLTAGVSPNDRHGGEAARAASPPVFLTSPVGSSSSARTWRPSCRGRLPADRQCGSGYRPDAGVDDLRARLREALEATRRDRHAVQRAARGHGEHDPVPAEEVGHRLQDGSAQAAVARGVVGKRRRSERWCRRRRRGEQRLPVRVRDRRRVAVRLRLADGRPRTPEVPVVLVVPAGATASVAARFTDA